MPNIRNSEVERVLRKVLDREGFHLTPPRSFGQNGVDILATRGRQSYYIEVIGHKQRGPSRAKDFFEAFFRSISRIKDGAKKCVVAMPLQSRVGLPTRAKHYGIAWTRIGRAFPELSIWFIDIDSEQLQKSSWSEWAS